MAEVVRGMSTLLQYLLGAGILAVLANQIAITVREWLSRKRERTGLLRILHTELRRNQGLLRILKDTLDQSHMSREQKSDHAKGVLERSHIETGS